MKPKEQPRGLLYHIHGVPWVWFCTFTFGVYRKPDPENPGLFLVSTGKPPSRTIRYHMFFRWLRELEKNIGQKRTIFLLRHELGEMGQRPHFHALMIVPGTHNTITHRFRAMSAWEKIGGGFARIRPIYDSRAANTFTGYVSKASLHPQVTASVGADKYESNKFELTAWEDLTLSPALVGFLMEQ